MGDLDWDLICIGALLLGAAAVLWGVTNGKIKLQLSQPSVEERVARYPASAGAVVIKAQRTRALKRMVPVAILGAPLVLALQFAPTDSVVALLCERLGPAGAVHWLLRMLFPGLPVLFAVVAVMAMIWARRVLRGGYAPPLDAIVFHDTIAVTGWRAKLHAWLVLALMPSMGAALFYLSYGLVQTFDTEANRHTLEAAKCSQLSANARPGGEQR